MGSTDTSDVLEPARRIGAITAAVERSKAVLAAVVDAALPLTVLSDGMSDEADQLMSVNERLDQITVLLAVQVDLLMALSLCFAHIKGQVIEE